MRKIILASLIAAFAATPVFSAELIVATWKRSNGTHIRYAGSGPYCGTVLTGEYAGKSIGCMSGSGGKYKGTVKKLDEGRDYTGKATASEGSMKLSGCALGGLICKSETLTLISRP
ncbi:MAG: DUF2147 domain-containing protein [Rhizobiaceae bacterium]